MKTTKKLILLALASLLLGITIRAGTYTVAWDASPAVEAVTSYKVYSLIGTNRTLQASSVSTTASITGTNGLYQLAVTAINVNGLESDLSLPLWLSVTSTGSSGITNKPSVVTSLRLP